MKLYQLNMHFKIYDFKTSYGSGTHVNLRISCS